MADSATVDFRVPESAIESFEKLSGLEVTVHDLLGRLWPFLPPSRFHHHSDICAVVKSGPFNQKCIEFGVNQLRQMIFEQRDGRVQVCHAGLVEWVVPVFEPKSDRLEWVLFAGQCTPGPKLTQVTRDRQPITPPQWPRGTKMPEAVDDTKAQAILESLRQLAARLQAWIAELDRQGMARSARTEESPPSDLPARRAFILRYIRLSHPGAIRLKDLADQLGLSEDRAGHLVREACGQTFVALLNEARIRTAAALLRHSDFSVVQVALRAGFGDVSRFHRVFRVKMGITPHRYRRLSEQEHTRLMNSKSHRSL